MVRERQAGSGECAMAVAESIDIPVAQSGNDLLRQRVRSAWVFLAPMLIVLALVAGWPLLRSIYFSFTDASLTNLPGAKWIGFDNYLSVTTLKSGKVLYDGLLVDPLWHLATIVFRGGPESLGSSVAWMGFLGLLLSMHFACTAAGDVIAHRLFEDHTPRKLLASAEIEGWQTIALPREAGSAVPPPGSNDASAAAETVLLPEKIKLFWALDQLTIEVRLHNPQVNQPFNEEFRVAQFRPQEKRGQKFIDISDPRLLASKRSRPAATAGSGNAPTDNLAKVSDPPPLARLKEPEPLKAPEIPSVLPGDPTPEGVSPKRVGPVNPSLNVAPSSASTARGDATPISRRSLPRPR